MGFFNLEVIHVAVRNAKQEQVLVSLDLASFETDKNYENQDLESIGYHVNKEDENMNKTKKERPLERGIIKMAYVDDLTWCRTANGRWCFSRYTSIRCYQRRLHVCKWIPIWTVENIGVVCFPG